MSPSIDVDEDVYERLKQEAEPFVDTPNSVLRRVLGLDETSRATSNQQARAAEPRTTSAGQRAASRSGISTSKRSKRVTRVRRQDRVRAPVGSILPEEDYELPLLLSLIEVGGSGPSQEIVEMVGEKLANKLTDLDKEALASGAIRWRNRVQFVRLRLIQRGLMNRDAPRGIWQISDQGREFAEANQL
jgi:hypothetical protein